MTTPASLPTIRSDHLRLRSGLQLEFAEQGQRGGPTLLMLHGITDSWRSFAPVMPLLPPDWHVIALTQRGHGGSDKPHTGYRTRDFAADAAAFARALGLPPVVVVGHSMGATNAMRLALDHPDLVRGVVAAGAFASFADKSDLAAFIAQDIAGLTDPVPRALARAFQLDTLAGPVAPGLVEAMTDESLRVPAHVWREAFEHLLDDEVSPALQRITAPTLLVWGEADRFVPAADTRRLQRSLPDVRLAAWPGIGHAVHWERPERFARELLRFVGELAARTR
ncbi:MAG TPA: alpha/beta hydrolase [Rubrivivax sp.]